METVNNILTLVFTLETLLKIFGYGLQKFGHDGFNVFDAAIVGLSLADFILGANTQALSVIKIVRIFRIFRVLRVTRLLRSLKFMKILMQVILETLEDFGYMSILFMLFLLIFSLIGMQFFAGKFNFYGPDEVKRENFDDFRSAMITVFQIMTFSDWDRVIILIFRSDFNHAFGILYLYVWVFIGNYTLINILMAIIIDAFKQNQSNSMNEIQDDIQLIDKLIRQENSLKHKKTSKGIKGKSYKELPSKTLKKITKNQ